MLKDTAAHSFLIHTLSWGLGVGCIDETQNCEEELNGWIVRTENCVEGHHGTSLDVLYISLGD